MCIGFELTCVDAYGVCVDPGQLDYRIGNLVTLAPLVVSTLMNQSPLRIR